MISRLLKTQLYHPIIIILGTTAAVTIAREQIQAPVRAFNDVPQAAELPVE
jgi:hypothetical protein